MIKYILGFIIALAIVLVAVTIGANNDQIITFNYIFAESQFQLSTLVAILFGLGLILAWFITGFFYLKLKLKNMSLSRQIKRQTLQINELTTTRDKAKAE
ncbi:LapA family protein [Rodentibacter pneumotropicus]|uniref:Probable lipopolysaccharide assembly protein A n=1 Tax=Rodentibacter pneumotropicus TaxID=758 RepID=A0A4S2PSP6_9PAST|nr:LapA family protein [Rodentibacter pneumotropicus]THA06719.1 LapA family protein [Rodentibacter pneumotropicus]